MIRKPLVLPRRSVAKQGTDLVTQLPVTCAPTLKPVDRALKASLVLERLYLGDISDARNEEGLREAGVSHVVNCCPEQSTPSFEHITYHAVDVFDRTDAPLLQHIPEACRFIARAVASGGTVLVHCAAGVSRSTAVVVAYRMLIRGESPTVALANIKTYRPSVYPNIGFLLALTALDGEWGGARSRSQSSSTPSPLYCVGSCVKTTAATSVAASPAPSKGRKAEGCATTSPPSTAVSPGMLCGSSDGWKGGCTDGPITRYNSTPVQSTAPCSPAHPSSPFARGGATATCAPGAVASAGAAVGGSAVAPPTVECRVRSIGSTGRLSQHSNTSRRGSKSCTPIQAPPPRDLRDGDGVGAASSGATTPTVARLPRAVGGRASVCSGVQYGGAEGAAVAVGSGPAASPPSSPLETPSKAGARSLSSSLSRKSASSGGIEKDHFSRSSSRVSLPSPQGGASAEGGAIAGAAALCAGALCVRSQAPAGGNSSSAVKGAAHSSDSLGGVAPAGGPAAAAVPQPARNRDSSPSRAPRTPRDDGRVDDSAMYMCRPWQFDGSPFESFSPPVAHAHDLPPAKLTLSPEV